MKAMDTYNMQEWEDLVDVTVMTKNIGCCSTTGTLLHREFSGLILIYQADFFQAMEVTEHFLLNYVKVI